MDEVRVDRWLWSVRIFKTRSQATDACRAGHVRLGRTTLKPAHPLRVGDLVEVHLDGWDRHLEVVGLVDKRVGAPVAATCLVDRSGPRPERTRLAPLFARDPSAGRPTKRDRRDMDRLRRR